MALRDDAVLLFVCSSVCFSVATCLFFPNVVGGFVFFPKVVKGLESGDRLRCTCLLTYLLTILLRLLLLLLHFSLCIHRLKGSLCDDYRQTATETVRTLIAYGYSIEAPTLEAESE